MEEIEEMTEEFCLSDKISESEDFMVHTKVLRTQDVKEFINRQIERIDKRIEQLSKFDGLGETLLLKELGFLKEDLIKDAGEKLI